MSSKTTRTPLLVALGDLDERAAKAAEEAGRVDARSRAALREAKDARVALQDAEARQDAQVPGAVDLVAAAKSRLAKAVEGGDTDAWRERREHAGRVVAVLDAERARFVNANGGGLVGELTPAARAAGGRVRDAAVELGAALRAHHELRGRVVGIVTATLPVNNAGAVADEAVGGGSVKVDAAGWLRVDGEVLSVVLDGLAGCPDPLPADPDDTGEEALAA